LLRREKGFGGWTRQAGTYDWILVADLSYATIPDIQKCAIENLQQADEI
jgi:hypothetical protein